MQSLQTSLFEMEATGNTGLGSEVQSNIRKLKKKEKEKEVTEKQKQYVDIFQKTGTVAKTAEVMGVTKETARDQLREAAKRLGFNSASELIGENKRKRDTSSKDLMQLLKRQEFRCALSGKKLTPDTAELDHILPRSNGGTNAIINLQWLDKRINRMKGQMTQEEFIECCRLVTEWLN